jgi:hypothetical protein
LKKGEPGFLLAQEWHSVEHMAVRPYGKVGESNGDEIASLRSQ